MKRLLTILILATSVLAQSSVKPIVSRLSPSGSAQYLELERQKAELQLRYELLVSKQREILADEQIPKAARDHGYNDAGIMVFVTPAPEEKKLAP
jgi:hypothetical protein